jgi:hypothetical protein
MLQRGQSHSCLPSHSSSRENEVAEATVAVGREKVRIRRKFIYSSRQKIPVPEP